MLTEHIIGKSLDEVKQLSKDDILELLGIELFPVAAQVCLAFVEGFESGRVWN